jgi:hypothetical protein
MTASTPTVDDLASICINAARAEVVDIMNEIEQRDLTAVETLAMFAVLRPARERVWARQQPPTPPLRLVRSRRRRRERSAR